MPRTKAQPSRRALKPPVVEYKDYYDLVFRGYIEDRNVSRKDDSNIKEFERVCKSDDVCGVFRNNICMIDIDDGNNANIIQRILDDCGVSYLFANTTRGKHFFFYHGKWSKVLRDRSHILSAVGLEVDYKVYSVDCSPLSKTLDDGTVQPRPLLTSPNFNGELEELPYYLVPVDAKDEFSELKDLRNDTLFRYILKLRRFLLSVDEVKHTIKLINDYILPKPLAQRELNTILRDDAIPGNNEVFIYSDDPKKAAKLDYELFSKYLIEKFDICKIDSNFYYRDDGLYKKASYEDYRAIILSVLNHNSITAPVRREIAERIETYAPTKKLSESNLILFKNGVYDVDNDLFRGIRDSDVFFNRVDTNYNEQANKAHILDKFLDDISCNDADIKSIILEMIGYSLMRGNPRQVLFWLDGTGSNGKGTLFDLMKYVIGKDNISNLSLKNLNGTFGVGRIRDKLINLGDETSSKYVEESEIIKALSGGTTIQVEEKNKPAEELLFNGKLIFSGNGIPRINDTSTGINRRFIIIPMQKDFEKDPRKDVNFKSKLLTVEVAEDLIQRSLDALCRVMADGFTISDKVEEEKQKFKINNNPLLAFLEEQGDLSGRHNKEVYLAYKVWCEENGFKPLNNIAFSKAIPGYTTKLKKIPKSDRNKYSNKEVISVYIRNTPLEEVANR